MNNVKVATGEYINVYNDVLDIFVIINEPNDKFTIEQCGKAEDIVTEYLNNTTKEAEKEMEEKLDELFDFGTQVIIRNI